MSDLKWLIFIVAWLIPSTLFYWFFGRRILAKRFCAVNIKNDGYCLRFASGSILMSKRIPINFKNCLYFRITDRGFILLIHFPILPFNPPLFIPWEEIESITKHNSIFFYDTVVRIYDSPVRIAVCDRVAPFIISAHKKYPKSGSSLSSQF